MFVRDILLSVFFQIHFLLDTVEQDILLDGFGLSSHRTLISGDLIGL